MCGNEEGKTDMLTWKSNLLVLIQKFAGHFFFLSWNKKKLGENISCYAGYFFVYFTQT